jgi:uncharacterized protein (DUF1697 family)
MIEQTPPTTYVALLRGVNVGGRNTVPMAELRSALSALGLEDVETYIQSGNVVFRGPAGGTENLAAAVEQRIADTFDVKARVVLRAREELTAVAERNPFLKHGADLAKLHIVFLEREPAASGVAELDPGRSPPDEFSVSGREIYLHLPNGMGRSKLTIDYFERRLGVAATARNWKTLLKLIELANR